MNSRIGKVIFQHRLSSTRGQAAIRNAPHRALSATLTGCDLESTLQVVLLHAHPVIDWCRRRDSNSHGFRHRPLKTACLPISPRRRSRCSIDQGYFGTTFDFDPYFGLVLRHCGAPAVAGGRRTGAAAVARPCLSMTTPVDVGLVRWTNRSGRGWSRKIPPPATAVLRLRKLAEPLEPNRLPDDRCRTPRPCRRPCRAAAAPGR